MTRNLKWLMVLLVLAALVGMVNASPDVDRAKDTAARINNTIYNKVPYTITLTDRQIIDAGYTPIRQGGYTITLKRIYYDEANATLVTYINAWNNGTSLTINNPVRWFMPFNDKLNGAALEQAYVIMVISYLDYKPYGQPIDDDTLVVYPSTDGYAEETTNTATYLTMRNDAGDGSLNGSASIVSAPYLDTGPSSSQFSTLRRGIFSFNTAALSDTATISQEKFSIAAFSKLNELGNFSYGITGGTLASNITIANGDYDGFQNTRYATDLTYNQIESGAIPIVRTNWTLNGAGIANTTKTGYTIMYLRDAPDIDSSAPSYVKSKVSYITFYYVKINV